MHSQSQGVMFEFDGNARYFRGTLTVFSADNLAAWALGGYKALASAFRKCQYCMVTDDQMKATVSIFSTSVSLNNVNALIISVSRKKCYS